MMLDECPFCGAEVGPKRGKRSLSDHLLVCPEAPREVDHRFIDSTRPLRVDAEAERDLARTRAGGPR